MLVFKMNSIEDDSRDVILSGRYDKPFIKEEQRGLFIVDRLWIYLFHTPYWIHIVSRALMMPTL